MPDATITVRPNGAETLRFAAESVTHETEDGWRLEMSLQPASSDVPSPQVVGEAADVAVGDMHYAGQVVEYVPAEGRIVVEGRGPAPV
jgi:hypothetical protein